MQMAPRQNLFYGWIIVATALTIIALGMGLMLSLGVLMEPLENALGWSRGQISQGNLYGWVAFGGFAFGFGMLSDRVGTRVVVRIGAGMLGLGLIGLSQMQHLWHFYLLYGLLIGGAVGAFNVPLTALVTRWFVKHRGLAVALVHFFCCAAHSGPIFHMISAAIDVGVDKLAAATVFAISSFASLPGRLGTGLLADRFGSKHVLVTWLMMQATAVLLYLLVRDFAGFVTLGLYFGISYGGVMPLYAVVAREYFGARALGASYGAIFGLSCLGMGLGGWLGGLLFDSLGTYTGLYVLSFLFGTAGAVLAFWLRAPGPQHRMSLTPRTAEG